MQARLLCDLNAMSSSEIGEFDYDKRIITYNSISPDMFSSFKEAHALTVLSHCIYDMSSEELILRQSASRALLSFIKFAATVLDNNREDCEEMLPHDEVLEGTTDQILEITDNSNTWTKACIQRIIKKTFLQNIGEAMHKDIVIQKVCSLLVNMFQFTICITSYCCWVLFAGMDYCSAIYGYPSSSHPCSKFF